MMCDTKLLEASLMRKIILFLVANFQFWIIAPTVNADEIIKCKTPAGRIIYSDVPCAKQGAKSV